MKYDDKTHTAYNEAGHTVAYYYFRIPLISVTIIPDNEGRAGLTTPEDKEGIDIKILTMIFFAGPSAEQICLGQVSPGSNYDRMYPRIKYGRIPDGEFPKLEQQITNILKQPKYHYAIEKLANELLINSCFDGPEAYEIIENAIKEHMSRKVP